MEKKIIICGDVQSQKSLTAALENAPGTAMILGDHAVLWEFETAADLYTLPLFFLYAINCFTEHDCNDVATADIAKVFNFMINKKTHHRYLTLRLIEYFNLDDYTYTYSGSATNINDTLIFQDLDKCDPGRILFPPEVMMQILGDVTISPVFFGIPDFQIKAMQHGSVLYDSNYESWKYHVHHIFDQSLISLVTESDNGDHDKVTVFTEKTLFAVMGLTIPIWVGGYRHAEMFEDMGFDVFSDIIDHSYQHEDTMFMRCWRAIKDNIHLLQDLSEARQIYSAVLPRLIHNRNRLFSKDLVDWYHARMHDWPMEIKQEIYKRFKLFDHGQGTDLLV